MGARLSGVGEEGVAGPRVSPEHPEAAVAEALETLEDEGRRFSWKVRCPG